MFGVEKKEDTVPLTATQDVIPAQAGNLEQMFLDYHDLVFKTAYRVTGNATDAEDVLQTVFLRLARHGTLPELVGSGTGYFRRAAINASIDLMRSPRSSHDVSLGEDELNLEGDPRLIPDRQLMNQEVRGFLRKAVASLNPRDAEIFSLSAFEGYGNKEIAGMFELQATTVGVILHRIRARLVNELRIFLGGKP